MIGLISNIASLTGVSTVFVKVGGAILLVVALLAAVMTYNASLREQGADNLRNELRGTDNQILKDKAQDNEDIRNLNNADLIDELNGLPN